ncbi:MAG: NADPH-dependent oxidoreductase [Candidatus Nitrosotenuis sp.]|nr:MAG: NADPH-dependent oxidoreductase [Candidatus Nitrosotenuis sp.]
MKIVVISGSPRKTANTQVMMKYVYDYAKSKNQDVKFINLSEGGIDYFRGSTENYSQTTLQAAKDITDADVWLVGTPIYNSFFSAALKNLFEFINYKNTAGKTAGLAILASGSIGFTDVQTLLTQLMSYFRIVTNPKAVFMTVDVIKDGEISENEKTRLKELVDETVLLASRPK